MLDVPQILKKNEMFAALSETEREMLTRVCLLERVPKGKWIRREEKTQPLIFVGFGLLKTVVGSAGSVVEPTVRFHEPGDLANDVQLLDPLIRSLRLSAVTDSVIVCVSRDACLDIIGDNPRAAFALARSAARAASEAYSRISSARFSVESRTADALLRLAEDYGDENEDGKLVIALPLRRSDLAGYVGSTTESLIRVLSAWRKDGTVSIEENGFIEISNRKVLYAACEDLRQYNAATN